MKQKRRWISLLLTLCLLLVLFPTVVVTADTSIGGLTITTEDNSCYTIADNIITFLDGAEVTLSGTTSDYKIVIPDGANVTITLDNASITCGDWSSAVTLLGSASATMILADGTTNSLTAGAEGSAIRVPQNASLTIMGNGALNATVDNQWASAFSAVIGGQYEQSYGTIKILGGTITLNMDASKFDSTFDHTAMLGAGYYYTEGADNGTIIIENATVTGTTTLSNGTRGLYVGGFKNSANSNVIIVDSNVTATLHADNTIKGSGNTWTVTGNFTLKTDLEIPEGVTLTIPENCSLTIADGAELTNNGTITNNGSITISNSGKILMNFGSTYSGNAFSGGGLSYQILWDLDGDGVTDDTAYVSAGDTPAHADGSRAATESTVYTFTGWLPAITAADQPAVYTAQFNADLRTYTITLPEDPEGYSISTLNDLDEMAYGSTFTFSVNISEEHLKTDSFAVKADGSTLTPDANGIYSVTVLNPIEITVDGVVADTTAPRIFGVTDGGTHYTTQKVTVTDINLSLVTVNGTESDADITLAGNVDTVYTIVASDKRGNETTLTVIMKPIADLSDMIEGITPENVTSADEDHIKEYFDCLQALIGENTTTDEITALQELIDGAEMLLDQLEDAEQAGNAETVEMVQDITQDNVTLADKSALEQARADIAAALKNYGSNYTNGERAQLEEALERIEAALEAIRIVEEAETAIETLPDSVVPGDIQSETQIKAAKDLYDGLSDYEKSLISDEAGRKLENLLAQLSDYRITRGDGTIYTDDTSSAPPKTGEDSSIMLWFAVMLAAGAVLYSTVLSIRKRRSTK